METTSVFSGSSMKNDDHGTTLLALVLGAKNGKDGAFAEIYNLYFQKIYKFIYYRVSHTEVAEDLTEDVFVKAFHKIASLSNETAFEGWLYQIARNKVIDYYRDKKVLVPLEEIENTLQYETNVVDVLNVEDNQKTFLVLIKQLTAEQQQVIRLKFLENLENEVIAGIMKKTEGSIRVIQHRAIAKLQELIKELENK